MIMISHLTHGSPPGPLNLSCLAVTCSRSIGKMETIRGASLVFVWRNLQTHLPFSSASRVCPRASQSQLCLLRSRFPLPLFSQGLRSKTCSVSPGPPLLAVSAISTDSVLYPPKVDETLLWPSHSLPANTSVLHFPLH